MAQLEAAVKEGEEHIKSSANEQVEKSKSLLLELSGELHQAVIEVFIVPKYGDRLLGQISRPYR